MYSSRKAINLSVLHGLPITPQSEPCHRNEFGDISYCQGFDFDPFSVTKGMILANGLHSQGYGCENPGRTPPSKFFGVPPGTSRPNSLAELVTVLARDSECAINPGPTPSVLIHLAGTIKCMLSRM